MLFSAIDSSDQDLEDEVGFGEKFSECNRVSPKLAWQWRSANSHRTEHDADN